MDEAGGVRTLQFGSTIQSSLRIDDPALSGLDYVEFFHIPFLQREHIGRALFIGLGAGSGPAQFLLDYPDLRIDVVEIDPVVIRVAGESFGFISSSRCAIHEDDGFSWVARTRRRWDLIIIDAYMTEKGRLVIPSELMTEEFFELCAKRLTAGGIVSFNCAAPADDQLTREVHDALGAVFPSLLTFELTSTDNTVLFGSNAALEIRSGKMVESARRMLETGRLRRRGLIRRCRQVRRDLSRTRAE